jgi:hypothetical protein
MKNKLEIRPYHLSYREQILALFHLAHSGKRLSGNFYRWRYEENPFGPIMVDLMFDQDKLVGHYAVCPAQGNIFGQQYPIVLSMNTFTHPDYWGKGIFTCLAENLYKRIVQEMGIYMVYGFPNLNSHYNFIKKLSWRDVFLVPTLWREIDADHKASRFEFEIVETADSRFDELWMRIEKKYIFANERSSKFINWRFVECPLKKYTILTRGTDKKIEAYAVIKDYINEGILELDLVDFLIDEHVDGADFLNGILSFARKGNYKRVNAWVPIGHDLYNYAEKIKFTPNVPLTYLCFRIFLEIANSQVFYQSTSWYLTMADSDVY